MADIPMMVTSNPYMHAMSLDCDYTGSLLKATRLCVRSLDHSLHAYKTELDAISDEIEGQLIGFSRTPLRYP